MLTANELGQIIRDLLASASVIGPDGELIMSIINDNGTIKIETDDGGDHLEYQVLCSGATLLEAQRQGVDERVARRTRIDDPSPDIKMMDKTPRRPADNNPKKTARGKAALRRRIAHNKKHPEQFEDVISHIENSILEGKAVECSDADIAKWAESIDPIAVSSLISEWNNSELSKINEIIHNVWDKQLLELYVGIANGRDSELKMFDEAAELLAQVKEWGHKLCWIERIEKPSYAIYKVCGDVVPSNVFVERRASDDRNVILSGDRANIIEIVYS
jgi:hypothetical protein